MTDTQTSPLDKAYILEITDANGQGEIYCTSRSECVRYAYDMFGLLATQWYRLGMRTNTADDGQRKYRIIYPVTGFQPYV